MKSTGRVRWAPKCAQGCVHLGLKPLPQSPGVSLSRFGHIGSTTRPQKRYRRLSMTGSAPKTDCSRISATTSRKCAGCRTWSGRGRSRCGGCSGTGRPSRTSTACGVWVNRASTNVSIHSQWCSAPTASVTNKCPSSSVRQSPPISPKGSWPRPLAPCATSSSTSLSKQQHASTK